jgi:hypothetical protein
MKRAQLLAISRERTVVLVAGVLVAVTMAMASAPAQAQRFVGHVRGPAFSQWHGGYWAHNWHGGVYGWWWVVGPGWWYPYPAPYYPYPDYYTPPAVVMDSQPAAPVAAPAPQVWYYCEPSKAYYPYVPTCSAPWRQVPAVPQPTPGGPGQ